MTEKKTVAYPYSIQAECLEIVCGKHHGKSLRKNRDYLISAASRQDSNKLDTFPEKRVTSQAEPNSNACRGPDASRGVFWLADCKGITVQYVHVAVSQCRLTHTNRAEPLWSTTDIICGMMTNFLE